MKNEPIELSRRKILLGVGTVGAAGAGAGLGTSALFSDTERFSNNTITAGKLDLHVGWETVYDGPGDVQVDDGTLDGEPALLVDLGDLKPGDTGRWTFCFDVVDNPAYLWLGGALTADAEVDQTEPEAAADLTDGSIGTRVGELGDAIEATLAYDNGPTITDGSLKSVVEELQFGVPLDGDGDTEGRSCYPTGGGHCVELEWTLPLDVGNEVQSDSVGFGIQFFAQQCRNNDGTTNPTLDAVVPAGGSIQTAVDGASAGDVIGIAPGTFTEQVVVDEAITLVGAGQGATVVQSPSSLASRFSRSGDSNYPVVSLETDGAQLWNLTVDGDRRGSGHEAFIGVGAYNAAAHVSGVEVTNVTEDPFSGVQHGLGIFAYTDDGVDRSAVVDGCHVHDYQKVGVIGEGAGLDLCVFDSTVTGVGPTDEIGQNGIQVSDVAQAAIVGNTVTDNYYTPSSESAGIIVFGSDEVLVDRNVLEDNNNGLGALGAGPTTARRNNVVGNDTGALGLSSPSVDVTGNWWGAADGPSASTLYSGGDTDPVTGETADGSGDAVYDVHWDPYATSPFDL